MGITDRLKSVAQYSIMGVPLFIILIVLIVGIAGLWYMFGGDNKKVTFSENNEGGNSVETGEKNTIYFFFASWCPHCKTARPVWDKIVDEYNGKLVNGQKFVFHEIDCSEKSNTSDEMMTKFDVDGFPTVKMQDADGTIIDFDAAITEENMVQFLNK